MRFALLATSAAALAAVTGCSSTPPTPADGAWFVSMVQGTSGMCSLQDIMANVGTINDQQKGMVIVDGDHNTSITCSVTQSGSSFTVQAEGIASGDSTVQASTLDIAIPSIGKGASMSSPATGKVTFLSPATANNQFSGSDCTFFFSSSKEGVELGQVWVSFVCPTVTFGQNMSTCSINQGFAIFENCATM